ncbi:MAG: PAS domain-containing protein [Bacteroidetes bacterium]|nr:MAG: PAS domain-containing protein [Bacteroidota bacterium]
MTEEEFKALSLLHTNDFVSLHKVNGKTLYVSSNCERITGYTSTEFKSHNPYDFFHPEDVMAIEKNTFPLLLGNQEETITEFRFKKKNQKYSWFEVKGRPIKNEAGDVVFMLSIARDISQLKEYLDRIRQKEAMLFEAGKMARIGAWELEIETETLHWSRMTYEIHELEQGKIPKLEEAINFYAPEARPIITKAVQDAIEKGIPYDLKLPFITAKGNELWVRAIGKPEHQEGKTPRLFGVFQDITQEVEQQLQQKALINQLTTQKQQLQEYNQIVSHNLRSPVSSLNALLHFISKTEDQEEKNKIIENIKEVTSSLNNLLEELVDAVKVINNEELVFEEVSVTTAVAGVKNMLDGSIKELDAQLTVNTDAWETVHFPKLYFNSILLNLISNSLKYYSPSRKPEIIITTGYEGKAKTLSISDNGLGIDLARHKDKVFKLHKTFHRQRPGKGLGLFMTRNQIQSTGGSISVESEVDKGTTFKIVFNNYHVYEHEA